MFFKPLVDSLMIDGHDVLCTSRDYREATELARLKDFKIKWSVSMEEKVNTTS